jgi:energy-converting hydrogenase B subunit D
MIWIFDLIILIFLVITSIIALQVKDLLSAAMIFGVYSFLMCLLWAGMGAVDVAFTEAAVGAGVSAVFMISTIFRTSRRSSD